MVEHQPALRLQLESVPKAVRAAIGLCGIKQAAVGPAVPQPAAALLWTEMLLKERGHEAFFTGE